jgi:hypothetical protein
MKFQVLWDAMFLFGQTASGVQTILVPSYSKSSNRKTVIPFTLLDLEEEGTTIIQNVEEVQPYDKAKCSRRLERSATPL